MDRRSLKRTSIDRRFSSLLRDILKTFHEQKTLQMSITVKNHFKVVLMVQGQPFKCHHRLKNLEACSIDNNLKNLDKGPFSKQV